jgi:hypothetical protein
MQKGGKMGERNEGSRQTPSDETTPGSTMGETTAQTTGDSTTTTTRGDTTGQTTADTTTSTTGDTKTRPYNLIFAIVCVVLAVGAYLLTMLLFKGLINAPADVAVVSGALGVLFTLIGTVAAAYFGIKSTQDTTDKAAQQLKEEAQRTERANQAARKALGGD